MSYKSRLIELASSGKHHDVRVDPVSLLRLILWVDTMCPYRGDEEIREIPDPEFQGVDWLAVRPLHQDRPPGSSPRPAELMPLRMSSPYAEYERAYASQQCGRQDDYERGPCHGVLYLPKLSLTGARPSAFR